eukprot:TRINITY_DN9952_c0_g1_i1.p1 TRINITY_DN9952_c0_g1~~TRINITY_DN9952_c0_g1_i1.p1  ORF type:complete len:210 (-),score=21.00 TRINITY_DN9952_c0_g1_i1:3-632(-)
MNGRSGFERVINARKEVIVSAGAVNSAQILMLSGIGPKSHLQDVGIECKVDLPVGQKLKDHILVPLEYFTDIPTRTPSLMSDPVTEAEWYFNKTGPLSQPDCQIVGYMHSGTRPDLEARNVPDVQIEFLTTQVRNDDGNVDLDNVFGLSPKFWDDNDVHHYGTRNIQFLVVRLLLRMQPTTSEGYEVTRRTSYGLPVRQTINTTTNYLR